LVLCCCSAGAVAPLLCSAAGASALLCLCSVERKRGVPLW